MIVATDRQTLFAWEKNQTRPHLLEILSSDHGEQERFESFGRSLESLAPSIRVDRSATQTPLPGFLLKKNIRYSALALGRELPPFLTGLSCIQTRVPKPAPPLQTLLDQIRIPCDLTLYIAMQCPHCPEVVNTIFPLAVFSDKISLHIIDGTLFPETAQKAKVLSAPCLILDNGFRWTGAVTAEEILSMITRRDVSRLSAHTLRTILEQGDADWISREMVQADTLFQGFVQLLYHDTWSVRLGAMVVVESLVEKKPELALKLCSPLIQAFDHSDISVQGDIFYALGETGNLETKQWVEKQIENLTNQDLKDAAQDALDAIASRFP
jgi:glutaredoxin